MFDELAERLRAVPTATAKQLLREMGVDRTVMKGLRAMTSGRRVAGTARTLHYLPYREDAAPPQTGLNRHLIDSIGSGEIVVIDAGGNDEGAVLGDMLAARAQSCGAAGVVADGVIRDVDGIRDLGLAVWAKGTHPDSNVRALLAWEIDVAVQCGGVLVLPGDYVLADSDAAMVVPPHLAEAMIGKAEEMAIEDEFSQELLRHGSGLNEAYPIPSARREEYERFARPKRRHAGS
ncbi:MAG: hypothetical protein GIW95_04960 [Candidatus Eremiobacteraeota bacterium]|nr:hypothetical protein [Candidatus Eremiobacteraeota bacterium]